MGVPDPPGDTGHTSSADGDDSTGTGAATGPADATSSGACDTDTCGAGSSGDEGCPEGHAFCDGACRDTRSDAAYCGGCTTACAPTETCVDGACEDGGSAAAYPCDGDIEAYDAVVTGSDGAWTSEHGDEVVYRGAELRAAMQAAIDSLTPDRAEKETVLVLGDGSIPASSRVQIASYTVVNVCGTIDVTGTGTGDQAPIYARGASDIEIPHLRVTGTPLYAMFFRNVDNIHLGDIDLELTTGLGIRVDNHGGDRSIRAKNLRIDDVYVEGASDQGVETYGVDGILIGTVVARNVGYSGLLLNDSVNAEIGLVDGEDVAVGQGYAVFRTANRNGRIDDAYPSNIHVERVVARGGGRGVFCVSESGGLAIDHVDIEATGNNSILIENCYNVNVGHAVEQSRVADSGELRISARTEFPNSEAVTITNIAVTGTSVLEQPCAVESTWVDVTVDGVAYADRCP